MKHPVARSRTGAVGTSGNSEEVSGEAGMVTAETAVVMPALVLVLVAALSLVSAGVTQLQVTDAARVVARASAAGVSDPAALAALGQRAGGAQVSVEYGELVCVTASAPLRGPARLVRATAASRACTWNEGALP